MDTQNEVCNFRIVEFNGTFKIERKFKKITTTGFLRKKTTETFVWKDITVTGGECYRLSLIGTGLVLDTYKNIMPTFKTLEEAKNTINTLINPLKPIYHYC